MTRTGPNLAADFESIDHRIEALQDRLDGYRRATALSRGTIVVSVLALVLVLTVAGTYRTPTIVFSAFAALIGGTVWLGANRTSIEEANGELASLDAEKSRMIDRVAADNGWRDTSVH